MVVTNSLTGGGAERSMNLVSNELVRRNWTVSLVPINNSPADKVIPRCEIFPLKRKWKGGIKNTLLAFFAFNHVVKAWKPDLIILNCDLPELFGAMLPKRHKFIVIEHASNPWGNRAPLGKLVRKILKVRKAQWVAVSSHLTIWPGKWNPDVFLSNPLMPASRRDLQFQTLKRLVFVGRLSPEKRPKDAILIAKESKFSLVMIGDGLLRDELEEVVNREALDVDFKGRLEDPWEEVQAGDLILVPSAFEGDGLVVIEAIQRGIPILISDIPDFRRFKIYEANYCARVEEFIHKVRFFTNDLTQLVVPQDISELIITSRSIEAVGDAWVTFLERRIFPVNSKS
jgi:glycosyltransferase involved in cell wall biosynthesis